MENSNLKVKVTEHRGILVFETINPNEVDADFVPAGGSNIGCVLCDSKKLGVSPEAMELLKKIKRGSDGLGDPDIFKSGDKVVFGWLGNVFALKHPDHCEGSKDYDSFLLNGVCTTIENETAEGAKAAIDSQLDSDEE